MSSGCGNGEGVRESGGGSEDSLLTKLAWVATLLASLAVLMHGAGWLVLFLSAAADGSTEAWAELVHATPELVIAYALVVLSPPLAAQPFFAVIGFSRHEKKECIHRSGSFGLVIYLGRDPVR